MREVIEQLGMTRRITARAEVVHAAHQPLAEELLPDAVDRNAGGERMTRIRDPIGQLQATTLPGGNRGLRFPHRHTHQTTRHGVAQRIRIASDGHAHVGGLFRILHRDGLRFARMKILAVTDAEFERGEFLFQLVEALFARRIRFVTQRFRLGLQFLFFLSPARQLLVVRAGGYLVLFQLRQRHALDIAPDAVACFERRLRAAEHARQRVIVLLADGVELVIMAAHAAQRHAKEGGAHLTYLTVHEVVFHLELVDGVDVHITQHDETGRDEVFSALLW